MWQKGQSENINYSLPLPIGQIYENNKIWTVGIVVTDTYTHIYIYISLLII